MLANLVTTILLALGVATGNVSSNVYKSGNAFYDVEKTTKPVQKAQIHNNYTYTLQNSYIDQQYGNNDPNQEYVWNNKKYFLGGASSLNANLGTIENTIYTTTYNNSIPSDTLTYSWMLGLYKITPYIETYNTEMYFNNIVNLQSNSIYDTQVNYDITIYNLDYDISQYLNLTNNYNLALNNWLGMTLNSDRQIYHTAENIQMSPGQTITKESGTTIGLVESERYIAVQLTTRTTLTGSTSEKVEVTPNALTIDGYQRDLNYEVVDIPNVMYTVLTMPFSFISTAFNLTVFPGTPYALNFGNLFLTIIAIFILLWLLQKVFK